MHEQSGQDGWYSASAGPTDAQATQQAASDTDQSMPPGQQLAQQGQYVAQQAQQQAGALADQVKGQVTAQLSRQKERASANLDTLAEVIREAGRRMQERGESSIGEYADKAATQVERMASYLSERDVTALRQEAEQLARSRTPLFLAGAFAIGWLGARFFKSSTPSDGAAAPYTPSMNVRAPVAPSSW